jgi:hypothetical protein
MYMVVAPVRRPDMAGPVSEPGIGRGLIGRSYPTDVYRSSSFRSCGLMPRAAFRHPSGS